MSITSQVGSSTEADPMRPFHMECTVGGTKGAIHLSTGFWSKGRPKTGSPPKNADPPESGMYYRAVYQPQGKFAKRLFGNKRSSRTLAVESLLLSAMHNLGLRTEEKAQIWSEMFGRIRFAQPVKPNKPQKKRIRIDIKKKPAGLQPERPAPEPESTAIAPVSTASPPGNLLCGNYPVHVFFNRNVTKSRTGVIRTHVSTTRQRLGKKHIRSYMTFGKGNTSKKKVYGSWSSSRHGAFELLLRNAHCHLAAHELSLIHI